MIRIVLEGLVLGLSTGSYCLGMCFVFFMPYLCVEGQKNVFENFKKISLFLSGRLIAYVAFALIMGSLGAAGHNIITARVASLSLVAVSLLMLFYGLTHNFADSRFCQTMLHRFKLMRVPFFLGLFSGLNPCPPFLVGLARLWTLNSIMGGVVLFIAFFFGTSVYLAPLVFVAYLNRVERIRQIGLIVTLLSSVWFLFVGITGLMQQG